MEKLEWLSVSEAARLAGVSEWTMRRLLRKGLAGSRKVGSRWQVEAAAWQSYVEARTVSVR